MNQFYQTSLLVMVHGSPRPQSNGDMYEVVEMVRQQNIFERVAVAFMELNEPSIPEAIENLVQQGARTIIAVPYFLHSGSHVAEDLPTLLEEAQVRYPDVVFSMGDYLGHDALMADVIADRVRDANN